MMKRLPVYLYLPNLLCYLRILLAVVGLYEAAVQSQVGQGSVFAVWVWIASCGLDAIDGPLARRLQQSSRLGVLLDICADNILRTCIWIAAAVAAVSASSYSSTANATSHDKSTSSQSSGATGVVLVAAFIIALEWMTMVSTQVHAAADNSHWKTARAQDPWFIQFFFRNQFRNPLGILGLFGLFAANLFTYGAHYAVFYERIPGFSVWLTLAFVGRGLSVVCELYFCYSYLSFIVQKDHADKEQALSRKGD